MIKKYIYREEEKKLSERGGEWVMVDVYAEGDRGGGARLGVLVGVLIYTRFVLSCDKRCQRKVYARKSERIEKKINVRAKRDRVQRLNEQDRIQSS